MYGLTILTDYGSDIDEKLKRVPYVGAISTRWTRTDDWQHIADQEFDPESGFAQSGKAVAEAIAAIKVETISDEEIIALFMEEEPDNREPIKYRYNEAELEPFPPEVADCTNIFIESSYDDYYGQTYTVYASNSEMLISEGQEFYGTTVWGMLSNQEKICHYRSGAWGTVFSDGGDPRSISEHIIWSNFDIKKDGEVIFIKSPDPEPIYE